VGRSAMLLLHMAEPGHSKKDAGLVCPISCADPHTHIRTMCKCADSLAPRTLRLEMDKFHPLPWATFVFRDSPCWRS
jgi:hypothetical protein